MSELSSYRETLETICQELNADMIWFTWVAADLAFDRELSYLNDVFKEGDQIPISRELLHAVDDPGVKIITRWIDHLDAVLQTIANINAIAEENVQTEMNQSDYTGEAPERVDRYMEVLKLASTYLDEIQVHLLNYMGALAERNPSCVNIVQRFIQDGHPDAFMDSPDANINLLHNLLWDGVEVSGDLYELMSDMENRHKAS